MKNEILEIADKLRKDELSVDDAKSLLFDLFSIDDGFINVYDQDPPSDVEILAKSPSGTIHLCHWRPAYGIFTCQDKRDKTIGWMWKKI